MKSLRYGNGKSQRQADRTKNSIRFFSARFLIAFFLVINQTIIPLPILPSFPVISEIPEVHAADALITTSRISCIAPCSIFFDGIGNLSWPEIEEHEFNWDFGEGTESDTSSGGRYFRGYMAGHVYESPGIYNVSLTLNRNHQLVDNDTVIVTILPFSGRTLCVSNGGDFSDCPSENAADHYVSLLTAYEALNAGDRLLLKRGEEFNISNSTLIFTDNVVGAFGSPVLPKPHLAMSQTGSTAISLFGNSTFTEIHATGDGDRVANNPDSFIYANHPSTSLILRSDIGPTNCYHHAVKMYGVNFLVDTHIHDVTADGGCYGEAYATYFGGVEKGAVLNSRIENMMRTGIRAYKDKLLIANSFIANSQTNPTVRFYPNNYGLISNVTSVQTVNALGHFGIGLRSDEGVTNYVIVEKSKFYNTAISAMPLNMQGSNIVIRNNVAFNTGPAFAAVFLDTSYGDLHDNLYHENISIYGNTFYSSNLSRFLRLTTTEPRQDFFRNIQVFNNLLYASQYDTSYDGINKFLSENRMILSGGNANEIHENNNYYDFPTAPENHVLYYHGSLPYTLSEWQALTGNGSANRAVTNDVFENIPDFSESLIPRYFNVLTSASTQLGRTVLNSSAIDFVQSGLIPDYLTIVASSAGPGSLDCNRDSIPDTNYNSCRLTINTFDSTSITLNNSVLLQENITLTAELHFSPSTSTKIYTFNPSQYVIGDNISYQRSVNDVTQNGFTVSGSGSDFFGTYFTISPSLSSPAPIDSYFYNWKQNGQQIINLHLSNSSEAINAAQALAGLFEDADGNLRDSQPDIGAYEYLDGSGGGNSCSDGIQNGDETGIDCGGSCPDACPNNPPVVNAGPDQIITLPTSDVILNGSVTDDGLPNGSLNILWSQIGGPVTANILSSSSQMTQVTGLIQAGDYTFQLSADDSAGPVTDDVLIRVDLPQSPNPPTNLQTSNPTSDSIDLTWTDNSNNETGFVIERDTNADFSNITSINRPADTTTYTDAGLTSNTTYYYRVRSYIDPNVYSAYSNVANGVTQTLTISNPFIEPFDNADNIALLDQVALDGQGHIVPTGVATGEELIADSNMKVLMHFNRDQSQGENDLFVHDWSGNGNTGRITGATYDTQNGIPNHDRYLRFVRYSDNVRVSNLQNSIDRQRGLTISEWYRNDNFAQNRDSYIWSIPGSKHLRFPSTNGTVRMCMDSSHCYSFTNAITDNNWHHYVVTINGTTWTLYIDGVNLGSRDAGIGLANFPQTFDILVAGGNSGGTVQSSADEFAVWNTVLSPAQVQDIYQGRRQVGSFRSRNFQTGSTIFYLNADWQQTGFSTHLQVSGDQGAHWCDISNGGQVHYFDCGFPSNQLMYQMDFAGDASVDQLSLGWSNVPAPCLDEDQDGYDNSDGNDPYCTDDGLPQDCDDRNSNLYPDNANAYCNCDDSDGTFRSDYESYNAGMCQDILDNDCDGLTDYQDTDCEEDPNMWGNLNLKFTGVDMFVKGGKFHNYAIERLWYDQQNDDDVVLYLKSNQTQIKFGHNADNLKGGGLSAATVSLKNRDFDKGLQAPETLRLTVKPSVQAQKNNEFNFNVSVIRNQDNDTYVWDAQLHRYVLSLDNDPYFDLVIEDLDEPANNERFNNLTLDTLDSVQSNLVDLLYTGNSAKRPIDIPRAVPRPETLIQEPGQPEMTIDAQIQQKIHSGDIYYRIDGDEFRNDTRYDYSSTGTDGAPTGIPSPTSPRMDAMLLDPTLQFFRFSNIFDMTPFKGVVGDNGRPYYDDDRMTYGLIDSFGDEWHTITFWDNDWATNWNMDRRDDASSDGKIVYVVVDPQTPAISFDAPEGEEYYTTPPKTYYSGHLFDQTTYLTSGVKINLYNITNVDAIYYQVNNGSWIQYVNTITASSIFGTNDTIYDFKYKIGQNGITKLRKIHYNPAQPAQNEQHPKLRFQDNEALQTERDNVHGGNAQLTYEYEHYLNNYILTNQDDFRQGTRSLGYTDQTSYFYHTYGLTNVAEAFAYYGAMEDSDTYFKKAKDALLFLYSMDPIACENGKGRMGGPAQERCMYSDGRVVPALSKAYDMLFHYTRENGYANGMTPIQHLKIRDNLASEASILLKHPTTWSENFWTDQRYFDGSTRNLQLETTYTGIAMAMPSYDTPYYGTSGADLTTHATHLYAPFPDAAIEWSKLNFEGFVQHPANPNLFRDSFFNSLFESDGSYLGATREGYVSMMYADLIPYMVMRKNFDNHHYERVEKNLKQEIISLRFPHIPRYSDMGNKIMDTYAASPRRAGWPNANMPMLMNHDFPDAALYLWAKLNPTPITSGADYLIDPMLQPEPPDVNSAVGNNYVSFAQNLNDPNTVFMNMKVLSSLIPHTSGSTLKYFGGSFNLVAYGERLAIEDTGGYAEAGVHLDEIAYLDKQNAIMIDQVNDPNDFQFRGTMEAPRLAPYMDYARMQTDLNNRTPASYLSSFVTKNVNQTRHVFFPDKKFFVMVDRLQSGSGAHDYDYILHGTTFGLSDPDTVPNPNGYDPSAFIKNTTEDYAIWRKPSGVRLLAQFISDVDIDPANLMSVDYYDFYRPDPVNNPNYKVYFSEPYIKARIHGADTDFLTVLYPLAAGETAPIINRFNTPNYDSADISSEGGHVKVIVNKSGGPVTVPELQLETNAEIALLKINASGIPDYYGVVSGSSLRYAGQDIVQQSSDGDYFGQLGSMPSRLQVSPASDFVSSGPRGGPFTPPSIDYTLTNSGDDPMSWSVTKNASWLDLSLSSGQLAGRTSVNVTVSLNNSANNLLPDVYSDVLQFRNESNGDGNITLNATLTVNPPQPPNPPTNLQTTNPTSTTIDLTWTDNSNNETGFIIERDTDSNFSNITSINRPANTTSYTDTGLNSNTTYYYRVKATNNGTDSTYSNTVNAQTQLGTCPEGQANSVSQYGITWTFDNCYPVGQFVNGDYWVVGPVTIVNVSPSPQVIDGTLRHGTMINPSRSATNNQQSWDQRAARWSDSFVQTYPLVLEPSTGIKSVCSAISLPALEDGRYLQTIAVLTVLAQEPPANSFRPPYAGTIKPFYNSVGLRINDLPALLPATTGRPTLDAMERKIQRPQIDYLAPAPTGGATNNVIPRDNSMNYGRDIARDMGDISLMLVSDPNVVGDKTNLAIYMTQVGIDKYHNLLSGSTWEGNGGHSSGRKMPIMVAGWLLNDTDMLSVGVNYPATGLPGGAAYFAEDDQTTYVTQEAINMNLTCELTGLVLAATSNTITFDQDTRRHVVTGSRVNITSGTGAGQIREILSMNQDTETATLTQDWTIIPDGTSHYQMLGYQQPHLGMPEWSAAFRVSYGGWRTEANPAWGHSYRTLNGYSWPGQVLALHILGLKEAWAHDAYFDYMDRYMVVTAVNGSGDSWGYHYPGSRSMSRWSEAMWDAYRNLGAPEVPQAPTNLQTTNPTSTTIDLTWTDNSNNETGFIIERDTDSNFSNITSINRPANTTSYTDTGLNSNTTYYYRIKATNSGVDSTYSNTVNAQTQLGTCPEGQANSVSQYGITWTFDNCYPVGQFVNGDWWVMGPVTVTEITPNPIYQSNHVRNGYQINPMPGANHALDDRANGYSASLNPPPVPFVLDVNQSLLSTISNQDETQCVRPGGGPGWLTRFGNCSEIPLWKAAVLTALGEIPPASSFRPPYVGNEKLLHSAALLAMNLLPNLALASSPPNIALVKELVNYVLIDYKVGWSGQYIRPIDNLWPGYGADISSNVGEAALLALSDINPDDKLQIVQGLVQAGIDLFAILENGGGWPADGGHAPGRKFPILFAGLMLNNSNMLGIGEVYPASSNKFGEDCQTYYDDPSIPNYAGIEGLPKWGIRHCQDPQYQRPSWHDETSGYRICCNSESWIGQTLAARILGLERVWNHQAYFDYEDRWKDEGINGYHGSGWSSNMWNLYRHTLNDCINEVQDRCNIDCNITEGTMQGEEGIDCGGSCSNQCSMSNNPPTVNAGLDQSITLPINTVTLTGSVTDDGLPNPPGAVTIEWIQTGGPVTTVIESPNNAVTNITGLTQPGDYTFQLSGDDSTGAVSDHVLVRVDQPACTTDPDCSDNNVCNGLETCVNNSCQPGTPLTIDDNNPCTTDSCDPVNGVQHSNVSDGTECLDNVITLPPPPEGDSSIPTDNNINDNQLSTNNSVPIIGGGGGVVLLGNNESTGGESQATHEALSLQDNNSSAFSNKASSFPKLEFFKETLDKLFGKDSSRNESFIWMNFGKKATKQEIPVQSNFELISKSGPAEKKEIPKPTSPDEKAISRKEKTWYQELVENIKVWFQSLARKS